MRRAIAWLIVVSVLAPVVMLFVLILVPYWHLVLGCAGALIVALLFYWALNEVEGNL